jgi:cob(I)alamin adenosyltransferase
MDESAKIPPNHGGDCGKSSLYDGTRLSKDDLLFEALGDLDELNSFLGVARAALTDQNGISPRARRDIPSIQEDLIRIGAQIATPPESRQYEKLRPIAAADVDRLKDSELAYMEGIELPNEFILPGKSQCAAHFDVARAVCRRVERRIVSCIRDRNMEHLAACRAYLNRLSSLLFAIARSLD